MFKLESYITPILLSYVDKYIKNFKPEDSQLSLWGGEVALHNLDLRLEVLEEELQLPFTFVSGHIHELIIHVPWRKLYSEPICITINTIECILKLRGHESSGPDVGGSTSSSRERRKRLNKVPDQMTPPGYVQTMVNKIVNNITINCCNLIVKYVEEDIVMSMNVKNLTFESANDKWEPEFSDFPSSQLMLRKIIKLTDVTICLDKRNASGKIDSYEEPVLYRCSILMRWLRSYNSPSSHRANVSRLDVHCHKMTFNISEVQVPMVMRLLLLARALQNREVGQQPRERDSHIDADEGDESSQDNFEQESWTGWAWNLVPSLPGWNENWTEDGLDDRSFTFHSGIYIDDLAFNLRVGDRGSNDKSVLKNRMEPFLTLSLRGCLLDYMCHDNIWVNSQLGICSIQLEPVGPCSCGITETPGDKLLFLESGLFQENYFSESLFSTTAIENCGGKRDYNFLWDLHQTVFSESRLLEKTPALALDYVYMVELTENCKLENLVEFNGDLEYSNLPEHALCRTVMGPFVLRVNSGLLHRFEKVKEAAALYDYQPYSALPPEDQRDTLPAVTTEEYDSLEENIPLRTYQYTMFQPKVELYVKDHPDVPSLNKRKVSFTQLDLPVWHRVSHMSIECQCLDARLITPMYSRRLVRSACLLPTLPQHMFHACHSHTISRALDLACYATVPDQSKSEVLHVNNILYKRKELFHPHLWEGNDVLDVECSLEAEYVKLFATKIQMLTLYQIASSIIENRTPSFFYMDSFPPQGKILEVLWKNIRWQRGLTKFTKCDSLRVSDLRATLVSLPTSQCVPDERKATLIFKSLDGKSPQDGTQIPFIDASIQWPKQVDQLSHAPMVVVCVQEATFNLDPLFYAWLLFSPSTIPNMRTCKIATSRPNVVSADVNNQSVRSGHRKVSDITGSNVSCERGRRSQTPLSVHSSDRDRESGPSPYVTQVSTLSIDRLSVDTKPPPRAVEFSKLLVHWFPAWQGLVISIDVAHWRANLPTQSMSKPEFPGTEPVTSVDSICLCLPSIQVCSASPSHKHFQLTTPPSKLPVQLPTSTWVKGSSHFPWSVHLSDFSVWTSSNKVCQHLLKPVTTKCTVGISTRFATNDKESITTLGLCIHNDTGSLQISINQAQAQILSNVLLNAMVAARTLCTRDCAPACTGSNVIPAAPPSPTTVSESASISEPRNVMKHVLLEPPQGADEPVKLSVWVQWTLARLSVNFYHICDSKDPEKQRTKLALDVEDLMSSLDLQKVYSKVKLKVASANIYHFIRSKDNKVWQPSPYQGAVMCGYEEIASPSSVPVAADEGCGLLTATLTRAKCRSVHSRWGAPLVTGSSSKRMTEVKVSGQTDSSSFITEILVKLQPVDFLICIETLAELSSILCPFIFLIEELNTDQSAAVKTTNMQLPGVPRFSSDSLPLLYLDLQAVRLLIPMRKTFGLHDTLVVQVDSVTLSPHAENPLTRTPLRPDVFHMAEQARILSVPGSEVEDRQYELNVTGLAMSTGQWHDIERCRKLPTSSASPNLRTMSENPALVWNSLGCNIQGDASEIVGSPKPNLMFVLAPLKICIIFAPAIVYHSTVLVCGHAVEIYAVSDVDVKLTTNQVCLLLDLSTELQTVNLSIMSKSSDYKKTLKPSYVVELAEKQHQSRIQSMQEAVSSEHSYLDSGIDTADMSSIETLQSSRMRGARRISRSIRYWESVHAPSIHLVHSIPSSASQGNKQEQESSCTASKTATELPANIFSGSRSSFQKDKSFLSPDQLHGRDRNADNPFDLFVTGRNISLMLHEDINPVPSTETKQNRPRQRPLFHILVTHPHIFFCLFSRSCSIQVSIYNAVANLGSPYSLEEFQPTFTDNDFPICLFGSCNGDPDPKTGVPPPLFKAQWTASPAKPAQLSIDIERPAKLALSTVNLEFINHVLQAILSCLTHSSSPAVFTSLDEEPGSLNRLVETFAGVGSVSFKAVQVVVALQAEMEKHITSVLEMSVASMVGDIMCTSKTRWGSNISTVERIAFHLNIEGLCFTSSHHLVRQLLVEPCNFKFQLELSWPLWVPKSLIGSLPHLQLTIKSEYISIRISPDHILCLTNIIKAYELLNPGDKLKKQSDSGSFHQRAPSTPASEVQSNETDSVDTEQHYTDDLRAGAFQFMDATSTLERDQIPLPYQCVFWESSPPAIAWRYPQPRSLTNVLIFPVPFISAPDAEVGKENAPVVICSLQYWSECQRAYQHYTTFVLSETSESKVDLTSIPSSIVSSVWRVLLAGTRDLNGHIFSTSDSGCSDSSVSEVPVVSPRALAGCMRIDSFFSASLVPNFQICLNSNVIQVSLINRLDASQLYPLPRGLEGYSIDEKVPSDHNFLWLSLNHFVSFFTMWSEGHKILELNTLPQLDILDYATLSRQNVVESFLLNSCIAFSCNGSADVSVVSRPIALRIGPSVTHTIAVSARLWQRHALLDDFKSVQHIIASQYILCNDTVLPIIIAQVDTDEHITLSSRQCHMYSWRSMSQKPLLHVSVADPSIHQIGKKVWSCPFTIDFVGTYPFEIQVLPDKKIILFVKVDELSSIQKKVTIFGQLHVLNQLEETLDLRVIRPASEWSMEACNCVVPLQPNCIAPSLFLDRHSDDPQLSIRVRIRQVDPCMWTGDIPLKENPKTYQPWLVKVPLQEKHQFICIWCRIIRENIKGQKRILVILSPMYAIQSFLPTTLPVVVSNDQTGERQVSLEVPGQGAVSFLRLTGSLKENTHQLHLRMAANVKIFPFGYPYVDSKKIFTSLDQVAIDEVLKVSTESKRSVWPLPIEEYSSIEWVGVELPNSYVQAVCGPLSPYCGTMLMELKPWSLLVNMMSCDINIDQTGEILFSLPPRGIVAPPKLEGTFLVGLKLLETEEFFFSEALQLAQIDWGKSFYMPRVSGVVPLEGHIQLAVKCGQEALSLITLKSDVHNKVRVVNICSSFIVSNSTSLPLEVTAIALRHVDSNSRLAIPKKHSLKTKLATISIFPDEKQRGYPLQKWMHINSNEADIVPFICVSIKDSSKLSCPLQISGCTPRRRFIVPLSQEEGGENSEVKFRSFVLSMVQNGGQTFLNICEEPFPQLILHNCCDFPILCAEAMPAAKGSITDYKVKVDAPPWDWYCTVDPRCEVGYSTCSADEVFPQITQTPPNLFVVLAVYCGESVSVGISSWSPAIHLSGKQEQFISIPSHGDVKVHLWTQGYSTHLSIETVSHEEICARDIRSRLSAIPAFVTLPSEPGENPVVKSPNTDCGLTPLQNIDVVSANIHSDGKKPFVKLSMFVQSCIITLTSPSSLDKEIEVSALTLDQIAVTYCPIVPTSAQSYVSEVSLQITLGDFQLDNQLYEQGGFDFPVVLMGQKERNESWLEALLPVNLNTSAYHLVKKFSPQALLALNITFESYLSKIIPKTVHLSIGPVTAYIEDTFVLDLRRHIAMLLSPILSGCEMSTNHQSPVSPQSAWVPLSLPVSLEFQVFRQPFRLASLTVDPLWLLLSVHSSVRLYIALDRSPLQFTQFCRRSMFTTSYNLGHSLSMHYLSGAIFGAGWVVSSLELLGSPGGFARTLSTGVRDFVSLPYHGILEGPWGFLVGVTHGSASLMKHFTAGTLTSVTKMASSVARNLDRLTLDAEHLERTEELRRIRPQGVTEGLLQGLTGLGISVLGAVGGLAHHPLQAVLSDQPSPRGLVTGVGRGLVGVFTKPLSGAADLIAMTGQGLLQGAGWNNLPAPRHQARNERGKSQRYALIKYSTKVPLPNSPQCLLVLEATLESSPSCFQAVTLMLTSQSLVIISADGNSVESQLPLVDLVLPDDDADYSLLAINFKKAPPVVDQRVWDFVNGCRYVVSTGPPTLETSEDLRSSSPIPLHSTLSLSIQATEHHSPPEVEDTHPKLNLSGCSSDDGGLSLSTVQPAETTASTTHKPPIIFHVNPQVRSFFLTLARVVQRQSQNQGFSIL